MVSSGSWDPSSGRNKRVWGKRGSKVAVSTHPKYSQDLRQNYAKYAYVSKEWAISLEYTTEMSDEKGKPSLSKTST